MAEFQLIGETPSAASRQQLPWSQYYSGQANVNEANRLRVLGMERDAQERAQAIEEGARRFNIQRGVLDEGTAYDRAQALELQRYNREQLALRRGDELRKEKAEDKWKWEVERPYVSSQIARNLAPAAGTTNLEKKSLFDLAAEGGIDSKEHALKLDPKLTPDWADALARQSLDARRIREAERDQVELMAKTKTEARKAFAALEAAKPTQNKALIDEAQKRYSTLFNEVERLKRDKSGLDAFVTLDPSTGEFVSKYAPLPWKPAATPASLSPEGRRAAAVARRAAMPPQQFGGFETLQSVGDPFSGSFDANRSFLALPLNRPARRRSGYASAEEVRAAYGRGELTDEAAAAILDREFGL